MDILSSDVVDAARQLILRDSGRTEVGYLYILQVGCGDQGRPSAQGDILSLGA